MIKKRNLILLILILTLVLVSLVFATIYVISNLSANSVLQNVKCENSGQYCHLKINDSSLVFYMPFDVLNNSMKEYDWSNLSTTGTWNSTAFNNITGGKYGGCYQGDASTAFMDIDQKPAFTSPANLTVSIWVKGSGTGGLVTQWTTGTTGWMWYKVSSTNVRFYVGSERTDIYTLDSNNWQMLTAVYDPATKIVKGYINGSNVVNASFAGAFSQDNTFLRIGKYNTNSEHFAGQIDEVMIFNRTLSTTEIANIYNAQFSRFLLGNLSLKQLNITVGNNTVNVSSPDSNQVGTNLSLKLGMKNFTLNYSTDKDFYYYYPFDIINSSTTEANWGNSLNNATLTGVLPRNATNGQYGNGIYFSGNGVDAVTIGHSATELQTNSPFSVAFWMKNVGSTATKGLFGMTDAGGSGNRVLAIYYESTANNLGVNFACSNCGVMPTSALNTAVWHHIVAVSNGPVAYGTNYSLYIDGVLNNTGVNLGYSPWGGVNTISIGRGYNGAYSAQILMDEVMIFNRTLSATEVNNIYNQQLGFYYTPEQNTTNNVPNVFNISNSTGWFVPVYNYVSDPYNFWSPILSSTINLTTFERTPPKLNFTTPTPPSGINNSNNQTINISIIEPSLAEFKWNWNGTNYTLYDNSTLLIMNFNNNTRLGENASKAVSYPYGYNGTIAGNYWSPEGKYGAGLKFPGSSGAVMTLESIAFVNFTIAFWTNISTIGTNDNFMGEYDGVTGWLFRTGTPDPSVLEFYSGTAAYDTPAGYLGVGNWIHLVVTYNGDVYKMYVNGTIAYTSAGGQSGAVHRATAGIFKIGGVPVAGYEINGVMDEVYIFNRTLSAPEISQLYTSNLVRDNMTQWYFSNNKSNLTYGSNNTYKAFAKDINGDVGSTELRELNISAPGAVDTIYPLFYSYTDNNGSILTPNAGNFTVRINNTNGTVFFWINSTPISVSNDSANLFNVSVNFSTGGVYMYNWTAYGNGTNHNLNWSINRYFTMNSSVTSTTKNVVQSITASSGLSSKSALFKKILQSISPNQIMSRLSTLTKNLFQSINLDNLVSKSKLFMQQVTQSINLDNLVNKLGIFIKQTTQAINFNNIADKLGSFIKDISQSLNINDIANYLRNVPKSISQSINFNDLMNKLSNFKRSILESLNLDDLASKLGNFKRNIAQSINLDALINRFSNLFRNLNQRINLDSFVSRFKGFAVKLSQSINLDSIVTRLRDVVRNLLESINFDEILNNFQNIFRNLNQRINLNSVLSRISDFRVKLYENFNLNSIASRLRSVIVNLTQNIRLNTFFNNIKTFVVNVIQEIHSNIVGFSKWRYWTDVTFPFDGEKTVTPHIAPGGGGGGGGGGIIPTEEEKELITCNFKDAKGIEGCIILFLQEALNKWIIFVLLLGVTVIVTENYDVGVSRFVVGKKRKEQKPKKNYHLLLFILGVLSLTIAAITYIILDTYRNAIVFIMLFLAAVLLSEYFGYGPTRILYPKKKEKENE